MTAALVVCMQTSAPSTIYQQILLNQACPQLCLSVCLSVHCGVCGVVPGARKGCYLGYLAAARVRTTW